MNTPGNIHVFKYLEKMNISRFAQPVLLDFPIKSGGRNDVVRHIDSKKHKEYAKAIAGSQRIGSFFKPVDVRKAFQK